MKKIFSFLLCMVLLGGVFGAFTGCTPRGQILKVHNWNDYMDEEFCAGFESWYEEKTGEKVKVEFSYFDTNESMLTELTVRKADFDVVCPSDYMNERLQKLGLLEKLDKNIVYYDEETDSVLTPSDVFDPALVTLLGGVSDEWLDYSVPYLWGTLGIMYRGSKVDDQTITESDMTSWDAMFNSKYGKTVLMKDSERDAFAAANIYRNKAALAALSGDAYKTELDNIMSDSTAISAVETILKAQKANVFQYEVDSGKSDLVKDNGTALYGMFWSCDAGFAMTENANLYYEVPLEGSNVWVDGFVISKQGKNKTAAQWFMRYLMEYDTAEANMIFSGSSSPVTAVADAYKKELTAEYESGEGFFAESKHPEKFYNMYMEMMFPSADTLSRCAIMKDFGVTKAADLAEMWENVKAS